MFKQVRPLFLAAALLLAVPVSSFAGVFLSVTLAPPVLPVYAQPLCPGPSYIWTPGYWAYGPDGYYWVPGVWVLAPQPGLLWTPGYWGWDGVSYYVWHPGYWATTVGFYGGVVYGHGYYGDGYRGGYWRNGAFYYNRTVNNIDVTRIHNTYNTTVIRNVTVNRISYNGGHGGTTARPTRNEQVFARQPHYAATAAQRRHWDAAGAQRAPRAAVNGRPPVAADGFPGSRNRPQAAPNRGPTVNRSPRIDDQMRPQAPRPARPEARPPRRSGDAPRRLESRPERRSAPGREAPGHRRPESFRSENHASRAPHEARQRSR